MTIPQSFQLVFLGSVRDFHAVDWYYSSISLDVIPEPLFLVDIISAEGMQSMPIKHSSLYKLFLLDPFLFRHQGKLAHAWRNLLKFLFLPLQVYLVWRFSRKFSHIIFHCHSMYYIWLAWLARVPFVGIPQGSDILIKPNKSFIYRWLSKHAMRSAFFVSVDSTKMANEVIKISGIKPFVIQNGIDTQATLEISALCNNTHDQYPDRIVSFRGMSPLYNQNLLLASRLVGDLKASHGIDFIYPFFDSDFLQTINPLLQSHDRLIGLVDKPTLYKIFSSCLLAVSIPSSDSSPRSVYEAIFCGAPVAVADEHYIHDLPISMYTRLIIVDLRDINWLSSAIEDAYRLKSKPFVPCDRSISLFNQLESFRRMYSLTAKYFHGGLL